MDNTPQISGYYELPGGYFDKDEQGWCTYYFKITQNKETLMIERGFDSNGIIHEKKEKKAMITGFDENFAYISEEDGNEIQFDIKHKKLIEARG